MSNDKIIENWFEEKSSINEIFQVEDKEGVLHIFDKEAVMREFLTFDKTTKEIIIRKITEIELKNANPNDFIIFVLKNILNNFGD